MNSNQGLYNQISDYNLDGVSLGELPRNKGLKVISVVDFLLLGFKKNMTLYSLKRRFHREYVFPLFFQQKST